MKFIVDDTRIENVRNFHREEHETHNTYIFQHYDGGVTTETGTRVVPTQDSEPELRVLLQNRRNDYSYVTYDAFSVSQHTREDSMGHEHTFVEIFYKHDPENSAHSPYTITVPMPSWTEVIYPDGSRKCFGDKETQKPPYPLNNIGSDSLIVETRTETFNDVSHIQAHTFGDYKFNYTIYNSDTEAVGTVEKDQIDNVYGNTYTVCIKEVDGDKKRTDTSHNIVGIDVSDTRVTFTYHPQAGTITTTVPRRRIDTLLVKTPSGEIKTEDDLSEFNFSNGETQLRDELHNTDDCEPQDTIIGDPKNTTPSPDLPKEYENIIKTALENDMLTDEEKEHIIGGYPDAEKILTET